MSHSLGQTQLMILIRNLSGIGPPVKFVMQTRDADKGRLRYQPYATKVRHHLVVMKHAFSDLQLNQGVEHLSELSSRQDAIV